ncbi:MAG: 2-oxoacid:acceptor oxidoreductase family protein [Candidatus Omnitrophota bacterium]|nr:2-oxoacid:acceptor oxidoreductase family protein [Candidatus Omnitrophota bacterium]
MNILNLFRRHRLPRETPPSESEHFEIVLSGSGGQGIVLAGKILAEAAAIYDQKEAVMSISYGPEARGGASKTEVIVSSNSIDYPKVIHMDVLLAMTQEAMDKYGGLLDEKGLLIIDELYVKEVPPQIRNILKAPFSDLAVEMFKAQIVANIIALGSLTAVTKVVSREALIQAVLGSVPDKALVLDRLAVDLGFKVVQDRGFKWRRGVDA